MNKPNEISDKVREMAEEAVILLIDNREANTETIALAISKAIEETYEDAARVAESNFDLRIAQAIRSRSKEEE